VFCSNDLRSILTTDQEDIVIELPKMLLLPLDDQMAVTRELICPKATRLAFDRSLRRHSVGNLNVL